MKVHEQTSEKKELLQLVPQQYHGYLDVFQDFLGKQLPPKRAYDHAIDLTPAILLKDLPHTRYHWLNKWHWMISSKKIWQKASFNHQSLHKQHRYSSYQRKIINNEHAWIISISICILFKMPIQFQELRIYLTTSAKQRFS